MKTKLNKTAFEKIYKDFNDRQLVTNDPLRFLYKYEDIKDREIVGLIASSLAYGRVQQIQKSVEIVIEKIHSPNEYILQTSPEMMNASFVDFKHRFTTSKELVDFLVSIKRLISEFGSLQDCFYAGYNKNDKNIYPALLNFSAQILKGSVCRNSLMPDPCKKSAFKRLNLYLRWMVRSDNVDPGGWNWIDPSKLIFPLDTHIQKLGKALGLTVITQNSYKAACDITEAFKEIAPFDPVKYDFSLTCLSMKNYDTEKFISDYQMLL